MTDELLAVAAFEQLWNPMLKVKFEDIVLVGFFVHRYGQHVYSSLSCHAFVSLASAWCAYAIPEMVDE